MATNNQKAQIIARDQRCFYCGLKFINSKGLIEKNLDVATVEHLWPASMGGNNSQWNLVAACHSCNSKRGKLLPPDYDTNDNDKRKEWLKNGKGELKDECLEDFCTKLWETVMKKVTPVRSDRKKRTKRVLKGNKFWERQKCISKHFESLESKLIRFESERKSDKH